MRALTNYRKIYDIFVVYNYNFTRIMSSVIANMQEYKKKTFHDLSNLFSDVILYFHILCIWPQ